MLLKNAVIRSTRQRKVAFLVASVVFVGCRGEGTFFSSILDGGGGFDSGFATDAGMDSSHVCVVCETDSGQDDVDASLPWASPFPNMGAPGFGDSTETLCSGASDISSASAIDVWRDQRGVFVVTVGDADAPIDADAGSLPCPTPLFCAPLTISFHDGSGWRRIFEAPVDGYRWSNAGPARLTGIPGGPALLYGKELALDGPYCALGSISETDATCVFNELGPQLSSAFVADATHAYAAGTNGRFLTFDGSTWAIDPRGAPSGTRDLWADASDVVALHDGKLGRLATDGWISEDLLFTFPTALWGRAANDLWVGTERGEVWRFDGQAWQLVVVNRGACGPEEVRGIWGSGDTVYIYGASSLTRWNGTSFESLGNWRCETPQRGEITRVVGSAPNDVFIAIRDARDELGPCDHHIVVHFDGTQFHRM